MPRPPLAYRRERWETPDGDFIDLDWVVKPAASLRQFDLRGADQPTAARTPDADAPAAAREPVAPLVVLFHGLEGSSRSHYALALMAEVARRRWDGVVVHFRGCSGEPNRLPRAYHSGDSAEIDWILRRLARAHAGPVCAAGVSLGGNALLKWLGETGAAARAVVEKAAAVSAPVDLTASGDVLGKGVNWLYTRHFLATLKPKALAKLARYPGLYDAARVRAAYTLREFDDTVTAPLHGFRGTDDYWTRASSKPFLCSIAVPTLMINARNDPFLPCGALPAPHEASASILLEQPESGGHVGFISAPFPGGVRWLPRRILEFFRA